MPAASWPRCCSACRPRATKVAASWTPMTPKTPHSSCSLSSSKGGGQGHGRLGGACRRYIEAAPGHCHAARWSVMQLQLCVSRSYWPAIHCGASSGSIAAMRASRPAKIGDAVAVVDLRHAAGAAEDAVVDDERDDHEQHAAGDAEEEAEALVDRADARSSAPTPARSGVNERDDDQRDRRRRRRSRRGCRARSWCRGGRAAPGPRASAARPSARRRSRRARRRSSRRSTATRARGRGRRRGRRRGR